MAMQRRCSVLWSHSLAKGVLRALHPGYYLSVDPGVRHIITGRVFLVHPDRRVIVGRTFSLSKGAYRHAIGAERPAHRSARATLGKADARLATAPNGTTSLASLARHHLAVAATTLSLAGHVAHAHHAKQRFHAASRAASCIDAFWHTVQVDATMVCAAAGIPDVVTVLYGDGNFASRGAPTVAVFDRAVAAFGTANVILVDEYRTTAICSVCGGRLASVRRQLASGDDVAMAGVKRCDNVNGACAASRFKDRDDNATYNIFATFVWQARLGPGAGRPPHLQRPDDDGGTGSEQGAPAILKLPPYVRPFRGAGAGPV